MLIVETKEYLSPVSVWQEWLARLNGWLAEEGLSEEDAEPIRREIAYAEKVIPQRIALDKEWAEQEKLKAAV